MKKSILNSNSSALPRLLVIACGAFLVWLGYIEYRQYQNLINQQQSTLSLAAKNSILLDIGRKLEEDKRKAGVIVEQWYNYNPDLLLLKNKSITYPFKFRGEENKEITISLEALRLDELDKSNPILKRYQLTQNVLSAVEEKNEERLRETLIDWLDHRVAFYLGAKAELTLTLLLFEEGKINHWGSEFVERIIFTSWPLSNSKINSLTHLVLSENTVFSSSEINYIKELFSDYATTSNIDFSRYRLYFDALFEVVDLNNLPETGGTWINISGEICANQATETLCFKLDKKALIARTLTLMRDQGLSMPESALHFRIDKNQWVKIENLSVHLEPGTRKTVEHKTLWAFGVKLIILAAFASSVFMVLGLIRKDYLQKSKLSETRESFFRTITHELKTPLASMRALAEALNMRLAKQEAPKDYLDRILAESEKMAVLLDNILLYRQFTAGEPVVRKSKIHLKALLSTLAEDFSEYSAKKIQFNLSIDDHQKIYFDRLMFELVIKNLVSNAIKYSESNVILEFAMHEHRSTLWFKDNASGIDRAEWENIFKEFYRLDSKISGTGLGLALSRKIMHANGGELKILSSSESGTVWELKFNNE